MHTRRIRGVAKPHKASTSSSSNGQDTFSQRVVGGRTLQCCLAASSTQEFKRHGQPNAIGSTSSRSQCHVCWGGIHLRLLPHLRRKYTVCSHGSRPWARYSQRCNNAFAECVSTLIQACCRCPSWHAPDTPASQAPDRSMRLHEQALCVKHPERQLLRHEPYQPHVLQQVSTESVSNADANANAGLLCELVHGWLRCWNVSTQKQFASCLHGLQNMRSCLHSPSLTMKALTNCTCSTFTATTNGKQSAALDEASHLYRSALSSSRWSAVPAWLARYRTLVVQKNNGTSSGAVNRAVRHHRSNLAVLSDALLLYCQVRCVLGSLLASSFAFRFAISSREGVMLPVLLAKSEFSNRWRYTRITFPRDTCASMIHGDECAAHPKAREKECSSR